uniref:Slc35c-1 n=1 Tax=Schmidtea mediterranea TaxID=79327 RepID=A0A0H3YF99_SCHMD|nr:slc35c-1 [Schmidtea mediterranea]
MTYFSKYLQIFFVVLFYWITSISMTFANKYLVGNKFHDISEDITMFVAWTQCAVTVVIVYIIYFFNRWILMKKDTTLPPLKSSILFDINMIIMILSFSLMLFLNNLTLKFVGISFFQIARSLTLVFTVIFTKICLHKSQSVNIILCCAVVVIGFVMGIDQEKLTGNLSIAGVLCGVVSSVFVALTGIFMKRVLTRIENNSYSLVYYMNIGSTVLYLPFLLGFSQFQIVYYKKLEDNLFIVALLLTGVLGFLINLASNMEINFTSPTTHQISNNAKSVLQTILAVLIFAELKPLFWWCSNLLVVTGAVGYTVIKYFESKNTL